MCYAGGQIWCAGLRKSGGNHGQFNKTELPREMAPNGKRVCPDGAIFVLSIVESGGKEPRESYCVSICTRHVTVLGSIG